MKLGLGLSLVPLRSAPGVPPNNAPVITAPATAEGDTGVSFGIDGISVTDADNDILTVTISVAAGNWCSLAALTGLTFNVGDGTEDQTMEFFGTIANINSALNDLIFYGDTDSVHELEINVFDGVDNDTAIINISTSAPSPSVYTLTLDDLSTRFAEYTGAPASIRFELTNGVWTTDSIYLDTSNGSGNALNSITSATDLATRIEDVLEAATGNANLVTVSGASSESGDRYDFTITFDASISPVTLNFGTSQWHPTIALVETVDTEGVADNPGSSAEVQVTASGSSDQTTDTVGNYVTMHEDGVTVSGNGGGSGWTPIGGSSNPQSFQRNSVGMWDSTGYGVSSGAGSANVVSVGSDPVTGSPEVHTITPQPVSPTGGTWQVATGGSTINFNSPEAEIATAASAPGWSSPVASNTLNAGAVMLTNGVNGDVGNLSPNNINLIAPEITHSLIET